MRITIIILSIVLIGCFSYVMILSSKYTKLKKEVAQLNSNINELENNLQKFKNANIEMAEKLSQVKHFDDGPINDAPDAGVAYTGDAVQARIDGEFEGWSGETIFKMTNGSIWQQASYAYTYHYAYMPEVLIYRKDGSYYMRVEDLNDEIKVVRIK